MTVCLPYHSMDPNSLQDAMIPSMHGMMWVYQKKVASHLGCGWMSGKAPQKKKHLRWILNIARQ